LPYLSITHTHSDLESFCPDLGGYLQGKNFFLLPLLLYKSFSSLLIPLNLDKNSLFFILFLFFISFRIDLENNNKRRRLDI
jgi:hypothetical protein